MARDHLQPDRLEELLRIAEAEEARALRAELVEFLKSNECRDEIARMLRDPLERLVSTALTDSRFVDMIGERIVGALTPTVIKHANQAAAAAVKEVSVTTLPSWREGIRQQAETELKGAYAAALADALLQLPALATPVTDKVRAVVETATQQATQAAASNLPQDWTGPIARAVKVAVETAAEEVAGTLQIVLTAPATPAVDSKATSDAAAAATHEHDQESPTKLPPPPAPAVVAAPPTDAASKGEPQQLTGALFTLTEAPSTPIAKAWNLISAGLVVVLLAMGINDACPRVEPDGTASPSPIPAASPVTTATPTDTPAYRRGLRGPVLKNAFQYALAKAMTTAMTKTDSPPIPRPDGDELLCINDSIDGATNADGAVDQGELRRFLSDSCATLRKPPVEPSAYVAAAQFALTLGTPDCPRAYDLPVTGLARELTKTASLEYVRCRGRHGASVTSASDYVALTLDILAQQGETGSR